MREEKLEYSIQEVSEKLGIPVFAFPLPIEITNNFTRLVISAAIWWGTTSISTPIAPASWWARVC